MALVKNYYKEIGEIGKNRYFNPNKSKGALIHPFRLLINAPSGNFKTNTILNVVNTCSCFRKIILCAANGRTEPLYIFLKQKLGKQLTIIDDIADLPELKSGVKTKPKKKEKEKPKKKKRDETSESEDSDNSSDSESEEKSGSESESEDNDSESEPEAKDINNSLGKNQKLVIFDDMIFEGKSVEKIINNWYARSRHNNFSVISTSQSWFKIPRTVRLNSNYAIFLKMNSMKEIKTVIGDFSLNMKPEQMVQAYEYATKEPGHFLLIDMVDPDPTHRFRKDFTEAIMVS